MNRSLHYSITKADTGLTIGQFLKNRGFSKPVIIQLKKADSGIVLNGKWSYVKERLVTGDQLDIHIIEPKSSENIKETPIEPEDFQQLIAYEDEDILVVRKPAGLAVHPSMGHHADTLANYCTYYYHSLYPTLFPVQATMDSSEFVFRCINRLDRDTSGLVLIAKNMYSSAILSAQQLKHQIHRTYLAVVEGSLLESGTISLPIARREASVIERCIDEVQGESAVTHFWGLETLSTASGDTFSLVKIQLETGRTHQIRVHMRAIGHPLPGDFLYCPHYEYIKRQALHSYRLEFDHPITGNPMTFTDKVPADFYFLPWSY